MAGLDGADGFSSPLWAEVERLLRNVPANQRAVFRAELNAAAPYQRDRRAPIMAQVQHAMLVYADGNLGRLRTARQLADVDWRDLLVGIEPVPKSEQARRSRW